MEIFNGISGWNLTLGQTGTKETGNLLDQSLGSKEGIVLASKLLDELLVLVELLQVVGGHGIDTVVLGTVEIVLVTKNTVSLLVRLSNRISIPVVSASALIELAMQAFSTSKGTAWQTYQMLMLGRGMVGSLMVPEKRLSRWGS